MGACVIYGIDMGRQLGRFDGCMAHVMGPRGNGIRTAIAAVPIGSVNGTAAVRGING